MRGTQRKRNFPFIHLDIYCTMNSCILNKCYVTMYTVQCTPNCYCTAAKLLQAPAWKRPSPPKKTLSSEREPLLRKRPSPPLLWHFPPPSPPSKHPILPKMKMNFLFPHCLWMEEVGRRKLLLRNGKQAAEIFAEVALSSEVNVSFEAGRASETAAL